MKKSRINTNLAVLTTAVLLASSSLFPAYAGNASGEDGSHISMTLDNHAAPLTTSVLGLPVSQLSLQSKIFFDASSSTANAGTMKISFSMASIHEIETYQKKNPDVDPSVSFDACNQPISAGTSFEYGKEYTFASEEQLAAWKDNGKLDDTIFRARIYDEDGSSVSYYFQYGSQTLGWISDSTGWRYRNADGTDVSNAWIDGADGKSYYLGSDGYMLHDMVTPDNYYVGSDGARITDREIDPEYMKAQSAASTVLIFDKSSHYLQVWSNGQMVYECVGTSGQSKGDKDREGDYRTPTGEFYVCVKNANSQYHKALGLSYPNAEDAQRGLNTNLISPAQYARIMDKLARGRQPDWNTALGGAIMIHGERHPADISQGCITISNQDIDQIWGMVSVGAKVIVKE